MAVYKVIQDVEAEDKLLGPLSLKQFIYAIVAVVLLYINFRLLVATELGPIRWAVIFILMLPALLFGVLAAPFGRDQPTEVWVLAHIRFFLKPRKRIWNQSGLSHLVTITVPKKIEKYFAKDLTQTEVKSRLQALASTLDSRGWAVKNVNVNLYAQPGYFQGAGEGDSDRLVSASSLPQAVSAADVRPEDDILDDQSNATAHHFRDLIAEASAKKKEELAAKVNSLRHDDRQAPTPRAHKDSKDPDYWFMNESQVVPGAARDENHTVFSKPATVAPSSEDELDRPAPLTAATTVTTADETDFMTRLRKEKEKLQSSHPHLRQGKSLAEEQKEAEQILAEFTASEAASAPGPQQTQRTAQQQAAILDLTYNNPPFSVATTAKQAKRIIEQTGPDEVVISLH